MKSLRRAAGYGLACSLVTLLPVEQISAQTNELEEVTVTATRHTSTVNRVPLSIAAQTQDTLDQQGIKAIADLQRTVPALSVSVPTVGVQNFSIRGIVATQGAATTGVYLDDTALQKRNITGPAGLLTSNGSPAPPLFDLERIEVLRGPQGTLYGGSSQGGTVRFITPQPSLTTYSGMGRVEVSQVDYGAASHEIGGAIGGPIVDDTLGFRLSALFRHTGGYIDMRDPYNNGALLFKDANSVDTRTLRGALLWQANDQLKVGVSWLHFEVEEEGGLSQSNLPLAGTFTTQQQCFDTTRQFGQTPSPRTPVTCAPGGQSAQQPGVYLRPSQTYGPYNYLGKFEALEDQLRPAITKSDIASLTLEYDWNDINIKSITSFLYDKTSTSEGPGPNALATQQRITNYSFAPSGFTLFAPNPRFRGFLLAYNKRSGITEEIRLASAPADSRLSWVGGLYLSKIDGDGDYCGLQDEAANTLALYGLTTQQAYGAAPVPCTNRRIQALDDREVAGFGEVNYRIVGGLTGIAGLRVSQVKYSFNQQFFGTSVGWLVPTFANTGLTAGEVKETPVTPKVGMQYEFQPNRMMYLTAAKGYRAGGVNTPLTPLVCGAGLATAGLTAADIPTTYDSDTVWSYELGGKFRLFDGRVQINSSIYRIDWKDVQLTVSGIAGCPQSWVQNAGSATSQGFDLDTQANLFGGLSANLALGYTDAQYTEASRAPTPRSGANAGVPNVPVVQDGDRLPVPVWQGNVGLRYQFTVQDYDAYMRGDYFYQGAYYRTPGPGAAQYLPDTRNAPATRQVNLRAGVTRNGWDVNVFVNNVTNSDDEITKAGGRSGCPVNQGAAACNTFTSYDPFLRIGQLRPREIGVQSSYRF